MQTMTHSAEQRLFARVPFMHGVAWSDAHGEDGVATLFDVSRSGLGIEAGSYFRPGPILRLSFADILHGGAPIELDALTIWCSPSPNDDGRFRAGLSVVHGEPATLGKTSQLFHSAIHAYSLKRSA